MGTSTRSSAVRNWDAIGTATSTLCFVHCVMAPVLFVIAPGFAHLLPGDEYIHRILAVSILAIAVLAIHSGYRKHRRKRVLVVIGSGLIAIATAAILGDELGSHAMEVSITMVGSALLIYGHKLNRDFCQHCAKLRGP